jgi:hypothetical protein
MVVVRQNRRKFSPAPFGNSFLGQTRLILVGSGMGVKVQGDNFLNDRI